MLTLGSLSNDDDDAEEDARGRRQVKNEFIFYQRNLRFSRSVQYANGSKIVLKLNVQRWYSIPNGNTKN